MIAMNFHIQACYNQLEYVQAKFLQSKPSPSHYPSKSFFVLSIKTGGMFKSRIVCSVFPLRIIMGGSICPSAVADKTTVKLFFSVPEEQTTSFLSLLFKILWWDHDKKTLVFDPCCRLEKVDTFQFSWNVQNLHRKC